MLCSCDRMIVLAKQIDLHKAQKAFSIAKVS